MKKSILLLFTISLFSIPCFAIEEVLLEIDDNISPTSSINKVFEEDDELLQGEENEFSPQVLKLVFQVGVNDVNVINNPLT